MGKLKPRKFRGTYNELVKVIRSLELDIEKEVEGENMCVVKISGGGKINWWKTTQTIQIQGNEKEINRIQAVFFSERDRSGSKDLDKEGEGEGGIPYVAISHPSPPDLNEALDVLVQRGILNSIVKIARGSLSAEFTDRNKVNAFILKAAFIVSTINVVYWRQPNLSSTRDIFVPVSSKVLKSIVGWDYSRIIARLIEAGLIERSNGYRASTASRRGSCKAMRISPAFVSGPYERLGINCSSRLGVRIQKAFEEARTRPLESPSHELVRASTFRLRVLDPDEVIKVLTGLGKGEEVVQAQMVNIRALSYWNEREGKNRSSFKTDDFGRVYSPFSNLFREARPFLRLDSEPLFCLDLHASHWFHALMLWEDRDSSEFAFLTEVLTRGDFYQFLSDEIGWETRNEAKVPSLKFLHSHPARMANEAIQISEALKTRVPAFREWLIKEKLKSGVGGFRAFSWRLMREESNRVIVDAVGALSEIDPAYPVITLHDALYVPVSREGEVRGVFESVYEKAYGIIPKIGGESPAENVMDFVLPHPSGTVADAA